MQPHKAARILTVASLFLLVAWGIAMVVTTIKPFWIDEWRLIYNLKCQDAQQLWGPLEYTQQFPRVFLQLMKRLTASFNYSYVILRLPSLVISTTSMLLVWRLVKRIYPQVQASSYLLVMILLSSQTFTEYIVQMKHYEMEILLSLVALWQLLEVKDIADGKPIGAGRYALLCMVSAIVPYFSYTYPIAVAPVFAVAAVQFLPMLKQGKSKNVVAACVPLALCAASICVFYKIDVSQLMHDNDMHKYWEYKMRGEGMNVFSWVSKFWMLFAEVGAGFLFELIFGILGVCAFCYGIYSYAKERRELGSGSTIRLYCIVLLTLVVALFLAGKLPVGEPKFNAFTVPAIAILIIHLLDNIKIRKLANGVMIALFLGLTGNLVSTIIRDFTLPEYPKRIVIYNNTEKAIAMAQEQHLPIMTTAGVAYPDDIVKVTPFLATVPAASVLRTFPAYNVKQALPVYTIADTAQARTVLQSLPAAITKALVGDGVNYTIISR